MCTELGKGLGTKLGAGVQELGAGVLSYVQGYSRRMPETLST